MLSDQEVVQLAYQIAEQAHKGQFRRDGITPYFEHPKAVASKFTHPMIQAAALLHDVVEDTPITLDDLRKQGIPPVVLEAVDLLTRRPSQTYLEYILTVKHCPIAGAVKVEDILHNLQGVQTGTKRDKYELAIYIIKHGI